MAFGAQIKSIQQGIATMNSQTDVDVTITAVSLTKSFVDITTSNYGVVIATLTNNLSAYLSSTTNVRFQNAAGWGTEKVGYIVTEYY